MSSRPRRRAGTGALSLLLAVAFALGLTGPTGPASADITPPTAAAPTSIGATVGPVFTDGLAVGHSCTASVIASPTKDLILTAAHCLSGTAAGWLFAPGYANGQTPYGVWTVEHAYLPRQWLATQSPLYDYAILQVAAQTGNGQTVQLQDVTGGNLLGLAPAPGQVITDIAYNAGINDQSISCTTPVSYDGAYPQFDCDGYVGGSSGSPWLSQISDTNRYAVRGVIGGLHQGGCTSAISYSSPFTPAVYKLLVRATFGIHPDTAPRPGSDGC